MPEYIYTIKIKEADRKAWRFLAAQGVTRLRVYARRYDDAAKTCEVARLLEFDPGMTCLVRVLDDKARVIYEIKRTGSEPIEVLIDRVTPAPESPHA
jgi:hypothetical protein